MRPGLKRSSVWEFFTKNGNEVKCHICKKNFKFSGNTSNLNDHLRRKRPSSSEHRNLTSGEIAPVISEEERSSTSLSSTTAGSAARSSLTVPTEDISNSGCLRRTVQTKLFVTSTRSELSEQEKDNIDESLLKMITKDLQPLSIVDNVGFVEYTKKLQPLYSLPNRKVLSNTMLPFKYNEVRKKLHDLLNIVTHISVTTDMWTSDSQKSFLSVTSHFVRDNKMISAVLSTKEILGNHTSQNIATELKLIFDEWSVFDKIVTVVCDNGANIKKDIIEMLQKHHHPCVAHTSNLCVIDAIKAVPQVTVLINKCRAIVTYFNHSSQATEKLKNMQKQMGVTELRLKQDVPTRWNSTLIMMERICLVKEPLAAIITSLPNAPDFLNSSEWETLLDYTNLFKPVEAMTTELSGENYPTMSLVVPLIRGLQYAVRNRKMKTVEEESLKSRLLEVVWRRLGQLESDKMFAKSTFLDPWLKKISFGNEINANNTTKWVVEEVTSLIRQQNTSVSTNTPREVSVDKSEVSLWDLLDEKVAEAKTICQNAPNVNANIQLEQYLRQNFVDRSNNPLDYWNRSQPTFPELYMLSKKYLCIPATSVPSERVFSKAGQIINDRRNRLKGDKLDMIIFLNSNLNIEGV
ncbi:E3 SUMO-protein ligase ZBED1-like [Eurosta solidaginis]|uniref:E3 SUMO-protein ligase ZBED1-like n=1 Tax=Eurosta solidaginis TaxID=178769 RepID=UPI003530A127